MESKVIVCNQCGFVGNGKVIKKGSGGVEIILWLCFLVPGLIYSVWRSSSKHSTCPKCNSTNLIPSDSPKAHGLMREHLTEEQITETIKKADIERVKEEKKKNIIRIVVAIGIIMLITLMFQ